MRRNLAILCSILAVVGALFACGASSSANSGSTTTNTAPAPTSAPVQHFKVGQSVNVGSTWTINVEKATTSTGNDIDKPQKSGDVFLILTISMKNISSQEQNVSSALQYTLQDTDGQKYDETIYTDAGATLDGKVEAGSPLKGTITYEVPSSTKKYTLSFQNDITSTGQTIWDISV